MRVLPGVRHAEFDAATTSFAIGWHGGSDTGPLLAAIASRGYTPRILDTPPATADRTGRLTESASGAVQDAWARARARGVPLVLAFGGSFCRLTREFEDETLGDDRVRAALASVEFLAVDVDEDRDAAVQADVHAVPALRVLDGEGRVVERLDGAPTPASFVTLLQEAAGRTRIR